MNMAPPSTCLGAGKGVATHQCKLRTCPRVAPSCNIRPFGTRSSVQFTRFVKSAAVEVATVAHGKPSQSSASEDAASALVDQLRALLEMTAAYESGKLPPVSVTSQLGLQVVTTSHQATVPNNITDTLAEEAEEGGGDGMAALSSHPRTAPRPATQPRPPSVLSALRDVNTAAQMGDSSSMAGSRGMGMKTPSQWGLSALQQLQARKAFMAMHDMTMEGLRGTGQAANHQGQPEPRFDPMDTLDDDEDCYGVEAAVPRMPYNRGALPWQNVTAKPADFLGKVSNKIASKVGGFSKAAAKKVAQTMAEPLTQTVALTSDAAAAVMDSASKAAQMSSEAVAAAAANLPTPVLEVAGNVVAAAKQAPGKLRELSGGKLSSWIVVDTLQDSSAAQLSNGSNRSAKQPVRIIVVKASADLTKAISQLHSHQSTSGLVSFESYKLGVKVPQAVYDEASALYSNHILPLIMDFLAEQPQGKVCFTGSGAGGSLATVIGLMAASRGLLPYCARPLVCAFDAAPVLAEVMDGALWGCGTLDNTCQLTDWQEMVADAEARGLLAELGLPKDAVLNISTQQPCSSPAGQATNTAGSPAASAGMEMAAATLAAGSTAAARIAQAAQVAASQLNRFTALTQAAGRMAAGANQVGNNIGEAAANFGKMVSDHLPHPATSAGGSSSSSSMGVAGNTMEGDDHMSGEIDVHTAAETMGARSKFFFSGLRGTQKPSAPPVVIKPPSPQLQLFKLVGQVRFLHQRL